MSWQIKKFIELLDCSSGLLNFGDLYQKEYHTTVPIIIDSGVFEHLDYNNRNYDKKQDIFVIRCPEYGFGEDVEVYLAVLKDISNYVKKFEEERSFVISSVEEVCPHHWVIHWDC